MAQREWELSGFRNKMYVCPLITGGHQERGQRAGTENTLGIVGLGAAAKLALSDREDEAKRVSALRDRLQGLLVDSIPDTRVNGSQKYRLPNTLNISFKYIEGESILYYLDFEELLYQQDRPVVRDRLSHLMFSLRWVLIMGWLMVLSGSALEGILPRKK